MAKIDLLAIQPHQVSRDLRGYSVLFYGEPKSGKTTTASKFPDSLLLAFEKGYNTLAGVMVQPINSWSEFRSVLRELKKDEVKEKFSTIIIDTADIAYDYCTKYICANNSVDNVSDIPYGKGYSLIGSEFDECLRTILQLNYGLVLISHSTDKVFKDQNGNEFNQIVPTLDKRGRLICERMCDIIGYSRTVTETVTNAQGESIEKRTVKLFMREDPRYVAGSRFKYTPDYIDFNYQNLVDAIANAIDKQTEEDGAEYFTDNRNNMYKDTTKDLDFDALMKKFDTIVNTLVDKNKDSDKFQTYWQPKIIEITDRYLGIGKKVSQCSRAQVEALSLIVDDLEELTKGEI